MGVLGRDGRRRRAGSIPAQKSRDQVTCACPRGAAPPAWGLDAARSRLDLSKQSRPYLAAHGAVNPPASVFALPGSAAHVTVGQPPPAPAGSVSAPSPRPKSNRPSAPTGKWTQGSERCTLRGRAVESSQRCPRRGGRRDLDRGERRGEAASRGFARNGGSSEGERTGCVRLLRSRLGRGQRCSIVGRQSSLDAITGRGSGNGKGKGNGNGNVNGYGDGNGRGGDDAWTAESRRGVVVAHAVRVTPAHGNVRALPCHVLSCPVLSHPALPCPRRAPITNRQKRRRPPRHRRRFSLVNWPSSVGQLQPPRRLACCRKRPGRMDCRGRRPQGQSPRQKPPVGWDADATCPGWGPPVPTRAGLPCCQWSGSSAPSS